MIGISKVAVLLGLVAVLAAAPPSAVGIHGSLSESEPCAENGGYVSVRDSPSPRWDPPCVEIESGGSVTWTNLGATGHDPASLQDLGSCFLATRDQDGPILPGGAFRVHLRWTTLDRLQSSVDGEEWRSCDLSIFAVESHPTRAVVLYDERAEPSLDFGRIAVNRESGGVG